MSTLEAKIWEHRKSLSKSVVLNLFFAPWTPKSQKNVHGPLNYQSALLEDPWLPVEEV